MKQWKQTSWPRRILIILAAIFVFATLVGVARGDWSTAWSDPSSETISRQIAFSVGYSFGSGFFGFVVPFSVLILLPIAAIVGIIRLVRRRSARHA